MLKYSKEQGKVIVKPSFENHKAIKAIDKRDKNKGKPFLNRVITFVYFMYNTEEDYSIIENIEERATEVLRAFDVFDEARDRVLLEDKDVIALARAYMKIIWTQEEFDYYKLAEKIQREIDYIINYDGTITKNVEFEVPYSFIDDAGEEKEGIKKIKKNVHYRDVDTILKMNTLLEKLIKQKDVMKEAMIESKYKTGSSDFKYLFD